jgi:hypothetical protein
MKGKIMSSKSAMTKQKVRIPVVVTKSGAIQTGCFWRNGEGKTGSDHDYCYDGLNDADYKSGCTVVHVEAEIDLEAVFKDHDVQGEITR